jgi:hypothetical protein
MNSYSLGSDSPKWWWTSAAAGAIGAAALGAILVLPASGSAVRLQDSPDPAPPAVVLPSDDARGHARQCFMWQSRWNDTLNGPQPVCHDEVAWKPGPAGPPVVRPDVPQMY